MAADPVPAGSLDDQMATSADAIRQAYLRGVRDGRAQAAGQQDVKRLNATMLRAIAAAIDAVAAGSTLPRAVNLLNATTDRFRAAADDLLAPPPPPADPGA